MLFPNRRKKTRIWAYAEAHPRATESHRHRHVVDRRDSADHDLLGIGGDVGEGCLLHAPLDRLHHLRPGPGQHLCLDRHGVHHGVRGAAHDQLRPQRGLHERALHGLLFRRLFLPQRPAGVPSGDQHGAGVHHFHGDLHRHCLSSGVDRLPSLARRPAAGAAHHRHRRLIFPAVRVPGALRVRVSSLPGDQGPGRPSGASGPSASSSFRFWSSSPRPF